MIDCCFLEDHQWVLMDYKTDAYHTERDKAALKKRYSEQVNLYAEALEKLTGIPVKEKILVLLFHNDMIRL